MIRNLNYKIEKVGDYYKVTGTHDYKSETLDGIHNFYCWIFMEVNQKGSYIKCSSAPGHTGRCSDHGRDLFFLDDSETTYSINRTTGFFIWKESHRETVKEHLKRYITAGLKKSLNYYDEKICNKILTGVMVDEKLDELGCP